ncbi:hypothetical protein [Pyrococcus horikoshii]|uniref:Condensin complex subunit 1 C-terminal domain-containing protein n=2 Tax=Pyrococcus horikoshii TaxID=53953 RepID=O59191_PYRHO|nr:hypothetical protein [Pyrococcus horikoshii]BAA30632.1 455aa long hypothetical protein [Pyrococcus horikoshii OT3]HII60508.1 hypothetical protein [Pyrococcus horikoshii]
MSVYEEYMENLKGWRVRKALQIVEEDRENRISILKKALQEKDPLIKKGTLYIIKKLAMKKELGIDEVKEVIPDLIRLLDDKDETVVLQAVETINAIVTFMELPEDISTRLSEILIGIVENKPEPINEYAAEGVATLGAKIIRVARMIFSWIKNILKGKSEKKKVSALRVLKEIVVRTKDPEIMEEAFNLALDVLNDENPVVRKAALGIVEVAIDRKEYLSRESLEKASKKLDEMGEASSTKDKIDEILKGEFKKAEQPIDVEKKDYTIEIIKEMFEREQHLAVLELAKSDYKVLQLVVKLFISGDLLTKLDALWVISNAVDYLKIDDATKIIPQLKQLLTHYNPWIRSTSAKVLAGLATNYPSLMDDLIETALNLLEEKDENSVKAGLELADAFLSRLKNLGFLREVLKRLIKKDKLPKEALEFMKKYSEYIEELEPEIKKSVSMKLLDTAIGQP